MTREHKVQWGQQDRISSDISCLGVSIRNLLGNVVISRNNLPLEVPDKPPFIV